MKDHPLGSFPGTTSKPVCRATTESPSDSTGTLSFSECALPAGVGAASGFSAGFGEAACKTETSVRPARKATSRMKGSAASRRSRRPRRDEHWSWSGQCHQRVNSVATARTLPDPCRPCRSSSRCCRADSCGSRRGAAAREPPSRDSGIARTERAAPKS